MENLSVLTSRKNAYLDTASRIVGRAHGEGRELTQTEQRDYDGLVEKARLMGETIDQAKRIGELTTAAARPITPAGHQVPIAADPNLGLGVARMARALAAAKGNPWHAAQWCERELGDSRTAKALSAGSGAAGGFLVPDNYVRELIELLRPASVVRRMGPTIWPLENGSATVPRIAGGASASYLGENTNIALTEQTFGNLRLTARKLACFVPISNDLLRFSSPNADAVVRDDLVAAIAQAEDLAFIRGDGTGAGPKGLRYWAPEANVIAVNATVNVANVIADLSKLQLALMNNNVRMVRPGWIMAPRTMMYLQDLRDANANLIFPEMAQGRLRGYPFGVTTQIPINLAVTGTNESEIYFCDFADAVIGEPSTASLIIDISGEAAYYDGSNVVAAFTRDQTVIRVIAHHDFGMRYDASVAVLKDVDWF